jgi:hypothetical protein
MRQYSKPSVARLSSPAFVKGQLWRIGARFIKIGHVGVRLVHYRTVDPSLKRVSRESLTAIPALEQFLKTNNAILSEREGVAA